MAVSAVDRLGSAGAPGFHGIGNFDKEKRPGFLRVVVFLLFEEGCDFDELVGGEVVNGDFGFDDLVVEIE